MERRKNVRRRDADLFVEDETELFRDALRAGQLQKVKEMLMEVAEPWSDFNWRDREFKNQGHVKCKICCEFNSL